MAILTITEQARGDIGGKEFRCFNVAVGSAVAGSLTITAASCGMNYFDSVQVALGAMTSADLGDFALSTTQGAYIDMNVTSADVGDKFILWAIGF